MARGPALTKNSTSRRQAIKEVIAIINGTFKMKKSRHKMFLNNKQECCRAVPSILPVFLGGWGAYAPLPPVSAIPAFLSIFFVVTTNLTVNHMKELPPSH